MEKRTDSPYTRPDRLLLAVVGVVVVVSPILFARNDRTHEWRYYEAEFRTMVAERFGEAKAATVPSGLQQVWVPALGTADRCISCHQATSWKGFEAAEHPFRTHPPELLRSHPPETFGCTACHGGQGWAVDVEPAHGPVAYWEEPLLGRPRRGLLDRGQQAGLTNFNSHKNLLSSFSNEFFYDFVNHRVYRVFVDFELLQILIDIAVPNANSA